MPDCTDIQDRGKKFEENVAALAPRTRVETKGGIMSPENYKSFIVNIRPKAWQRRFWIGRIDNYEDAQFIADLVYYYIGRECFHLKEANFDFPPLECEGTSTPLTSREMCRQYATSIAKGPISQQKEFIEVVRELAVEEVKRVEVQRVLQKIRDEKKKVLAVIVENHEEEKGVQSDQSMEVDGPKHLRLDLASHEGVTRNVDGLNAHVLGFDMCDTGFHLQSALNPVKCSWVEGYLALMEAYDGRPNHDAEDVCSVTGVLEENLCDCHLTIENIEVNFRAMEDAAVYETGESSSNFFINGRERESFAVSDSLSTHFCMPDEFITWHFPCSDEAYSF